jgi:integrase
VSTGSEAPDWSAPFTRTLKVGSKSIPPLSFRLTACAKKRAGDVLRREEYLTPDELDSALAALREGEPKPKSGRPRTSLEREQDALIIMTMGMVGLRPGDALR